MASRSQISSKINILFIPTVNVDGDLRRSAYGRINQNGPKVTGWRVNGQNLNLNSDWTKSDTPEIRNVVWVFNTYDLSFFADTHSTDGAWYTLRQLILSLRQWQRLVASQQSTGWRP